MKLLVLGAGGIGGYFGGRLAASGADVTFLVRPARRAQLVLDGLKIESALGNLAMPVQTVSAQELAPDYDLVLLTCKAYDLDSAMDAIAPAMLGQCAVVPMLNGMAHLDRLDARFGASQVMGGLCAISVMLQSDGIIAHSGRNQRIVFGERDGKRSVRSDLLAGALEKTTLDWEQSDDIVLGMWEKIVFLSALAATTCLFRANLGEILSAPGGLEAIQRTLAVNTEIATREGFPPRPASVEWATRMLLDRASTLSASMLRDLEGGGPVENDHIVGWMLARARAHGLDDTMLSLAHTHLSAYENRRNAGRIRGATRD